jgi:hypothetical protein
MIKMCYFQIEGEVRADTRTPAPKPIMTFIIRSAKTLRDGTVATNGRTEETVHHECKPAGTFTKDVALSLSAGSAFTITAEADDAARGKAGWAYAIRPA